jgi:hypothetical protein
MRGVLRLAVDDFADAVPNAANNPTADSAWARANAASRCAACSTCCGTARYRTEELLPAPGTARDRVEFLER